MTERTPLTTYRNSDLRVVYQFPQDTDLTDMVPSFFYRLEAGATPLLTVTPAPTPNGSSAVIIGTAVVVTLKIADLAVFPAVDVWAGVYDSVLTKNGFVNKFVGGPLTQYVDGSYGDELFGDTVIVSVDGTEIPIIIEGGNLGASVGVGLAALNAAVAAAEEAAVTAAAAAQAAVNAAASVPAMIAGKLDTDGDNATLTILDNLPTKQTIADTVARTANNKLNDFINVRDFGAIGNGVNDDTAAIQKAIDNARGRAVYFPEGDWILTSTIMVEPAAALDVNPPAAVGAFAPGLVIFGDGMINTRIRPRISNGPAFYFNVTNPIPYAFRAQQGIRIEQLAIIGGGMTYPGAVGLEFYNAYMARGSQLHIRNLTAEALKFNNGAILDDGWNQVVFENTFIEGCGIGGTFGVSAVGGPGKNEGSYTALKQCTIQSCGRNEYFTITGITNANPAVVTVSLTQSPPPPGAAATAHPFAVGERIKIFGVTGMTEVNDVVYRVGPGPTATTFVLHTDANAPVNSTGYGAFSGGLPVAEVSYFEPKSGGLAWKGQLLRLEQCGFALNHNAAQFIPGGPGLAIGAMMSQVVWENNYRRHIYCTGITNFYSIGSQFHGNATFRQWRLAEFNGHHSTIRGVLWQNTKIRAALGYGTAFTFTGLNLDQNTCRVRYSIWDDFDYNNQLRFSPEVQQDIVTDDMDFVLTSATTVAYRPSSYGLGKNKTYMRTQASAAQFGGGTPPVNAEWGEYSVPTAGYVGFNTLTGRPGGGALAANTVYNVYLYRASDSTFRLEPDPANPVIDPNSGIKVSPTADYKRWVGRYKTNASSQFDTSDTAFWSPTPINGNSSGAPAWMWHQSGRIYVSLSSKPTTPTGGSFIFESSVKAGGSVTFGSIAAGATATATITATGAAMGDIVSGVSLSIDQAGVRLTAYVSAVNTITIQALNPSAAPIVLGVATARVEYIRA